MITVKEFNRCGKKQKYQTVADYGVLLENRIELGCVVFLFAVDTFFVEVWFDNSTYFANHLVVIENTKGLEKYLDQISIKDLNPLLN